MARLLVVEDDQTIGDALRTSLRAHGHDVRWERSGSGALACTDAFDLVLLDLGLPDLDGVEVCRRLRVGLPGAVLVILTARTDEPATSGIYLVGTGLLAGQFTPRPQFLDAMADLPSRFLPRGYLGELETTFTPIRPAATVLYEWTGVVFWAVALAATGWLLRRTSVPSGDAAAARALLTRTGGSSLSWSTTWSGNSYWFDARGRAAIAYRVRAGVALTSGEPFGEPDAICPRSPACWRSRPSSSPTSGHCT